MSAYRFAAPPSHAEPPGLPTVGAAVVSARRDLSARMGVASGVVAWVLLARLVHFAWLLGDDAEQPPTWNDALIAAAPALVSTTLLGAWTVRRSLVEVFQPEALLRRCVAVGALDGLVFGATWVSLVALGGLWSLEHPHVGHFILGPIVVVLLTGLFGLLALVVSAPLGFVYGLAYSPVLARASAFALRPSLRTVDGDAALGAAFLACASVVTLVLEGGVGGETHGTIAVLPLLLALAAAVEARTVRGAYAALRARIHAGTDLGATLVSVEVADVDGVIRLEPGDAPPDAAVVSRAALATEARPRALALTSWCYRRAAMAASEPR